MRRPRWPPHPRPAWALIPAHVLRGQLVALWCESGFRQVLVVRHYRDCRDDRGAEGPGRRIGPGRGSVRVARGIGVWYSSRDDDPRPAPRTPTPRLASRVHGPGDPLDAATRG